MTLRRGSAAAVAAGVCLLAALCGPAQASYRVVAKWGHEGKGRGKFGSGILGGGAMRQYDDPGGIAIARNGTVLVVDVSNNRVERFTQKGHYLGKFGRRGLDKGSIRVILRKRFFQPEGIAVARTGAIFVADAGNDRVTKFSPHFHFRKRLAKHGSLAAQVVQPWGIAAGPNEVYVIDQGNYRVLRFTLRGRYLGGFGTFGRGPGQFVTPYGVAVSPGGDRVYVADLIRMSVMAFSPTGQFLFSFGSPGVRRGQFLKPAGVAVGPDGSVFVSDRCNHRVQHFTADGSFIESFGRGRLGSPTFLTVSRAGDVFVSDYHRVVRFSQSGRALAVAAHHNGIDITCRHVREMLGRYG